MTSSARTDSLSRRDLLLTGAFTGLASLLGSASASAQVGGWPDEAQPFRWVLHRLNGTVLARFGRLELMEQGAKLTSIAEFDGTFETAPLPGKRFAPSAALRSSANVKVLKKWGEQVRKDGPRAAMLTLRLSAVAADGSILKSYLLRNCFPSDVTEALDGRSITITKLLCGRAEPINNGVLGSTPSPSGPWFALLIDGVIVATSLQVIGLSDETDEEETKYSADADGSWGETPPPAKFRQIKFGQARDSNNYLMKWHQALRTASKRDATKQVTLVHYAADGTILWETVLPDALMVRYKLSPKIVTSPNQTLYQEFNVAARFK